MLRIAATIVALLLAGCTFTPGGQAFRQEFAAKAAQAGDAAAEDIEWLFCRLPYVTVVKRYGTSTDKADAYAEICFEAVAAPVPIEKSQLPGS